MIQSVVFVVKDGEEAHWLISICIIDYNDFEVNIASMFFLDCLKPHLCAVLNTRKE